MKRWLLALLGLTITLTLACALSGMRVTPFLWAFFLWPHMLFAGTVAWMGTSFLRLRGMAATSSVLLIMAGSVLASLLLKLTNFWNDGSGLVVLPIGSMFKSIALGAFLPMPDGPLAILRFLPLGIAAGIGYLGWKRGLERGRVAIIALATYIVLALAWQIPSLIAVFVTPKDLTIENAQDAFAILVRSQSDGFWTADSALRFFAPFSDQGKNGITALHGALLFLLTAASWSVLLVRRLGQQAVTILKKLIRPEGGMIVGIALAAFILGQSIRISPRISFTLPIAILVFIFALLFLFVWISLRDSITNLAKDEIEFPDRPLPSGQLSLQEADDMATLSLGLSLTGFALLGWPIFIGALVIPGAYLALSVAEHEPFLRGTYARVVLLLLAALGLAWAGLSFGLRELSPADWMVRVAAGLAIAGAGLVTVRSLPRQSVAVTVILGLSALISGQWLIGMAVIPAIVLTWFLEFREDQQKRRLWPMAGFVGWYLFAVVVLSSAFQRI